MNRQACTVFGIAGLLCSIAAAADVGRTPGPTPDPVPPPPVRGDMSRFGEGTHPVRGLVNPPEIYKDRDDRKRTVMHNLELAPGEKIFYPSGRNEPIAILDQSIGQVDPAAPTLIQRFNGTANNEWTPADPDVAVGNGYVVHVINDDYSVFDKCGNQIFTRDANDLFGFDTTYNFYDPKICYDPWNQRWIMLWHLKRESDQYGRLVLAISDNANPIGAPGAGWLYYNFNFVQDANTANASFPDYYDLGYSDDHVFVGGDQFRFSGGFRWSRGTVWTKSEIYNAATAFSSNHFNFNNPDGSQMRLPRAVKCQLAFGGQDATFVNSRRTGGSAITKWYVTDPFGANTRTAVDIAVADYDLPPSAIQPNGAALDTIDCRLMTAVQTRDTGGTGGDAIYTGLQEANLWAGDTVNRAACRLYRFSVANAVVLDRIFGGPNLYYWFPSIAADLDNNAYWTFTRGGPGEFMNARVVEMDDGVFSNSSGQIQVGSGNSSGSRWGDYFGGALDWDDQFSGAPGKRVWLTGMFGVAGTWDTTIASVSNFTRGTLNVAPATDMVVEGDSGGLFANTEVYTASNTGQTGLTYNVTDNRTWITTSRTDDNQLYTANQNTTVTVNVAQPVGTYTGTVTFEDCALNGVSTTRNVTLIVRPSNNACGRATAVGTGSRSVNNILADGTNLSSCAGLNDTKDVWYRFVARCNGTVQVDTLDTAANTDSTLSIFTECNGTELACNDDFNSLRSRVRFSVVANEDYYIRLAGFSGLEGTWQMFVGYTHDYNRDGETDFFDYLDFVADFAANDPRADFNADAVIDFFDYLDFVADFASAC